MEKISLLSLIVPAYKQEKTIVENIRDLNKSLTQLGVAYEIIVVVDGKSDKTYEVAQRIRSKKIRVLGYKKNQGKGHAIKYGVARARGDIIGFIDAGMDIDPSGISMLLSHMIWYDADIIIGSKLHPVSQVNYPLWRKIISWAYRSLTRILFGFKVRDTQVGIKIFKRDVATSVFPLLLVKSFAFDIEVLAVAYSLGYKRIFEAPIKLNLNTMNTTITNKSFWKVILLMLWDTLAVFYRVRILRYYRKEQIRIDI